MTPAKTLTLIGLFVAAILGSFIWFIATWDPAKEDPVSKGVTNIQEATT